MSLSPGDALVCCVKRAVPEIRERKLVPPNYTQQWNLLLTLQPAWLEWFREHEASPTRQDHPERAASFISQAPGLSRWFCCGGGASTCLPGQNRRRYTDKETFSSLKFKDGLAACAEPHYHNWKRTHPLTNRSPPVKGIKSALSCCVPGFHRLPSVFSVAQISSGLCWSFPAVSTLPLLAVQGRLLPSCHCHCLAGHPPSRLRPSSAAVFPCCQCVAIGAGLRFSGWLCQLSARIKSPSHISLCIHHNGESANLNALIQWNAKGWCG